MSKTEAIIKSLREAEFGKGEKGSATLFLNELKKCGFIVVDLEKGVL